jgi:addiction module RelB/DinJ family antitoxin
MKTVINIKADKEIKESAQKVAQELGLSLSTVINAYLRQFVRNKEVHLSVAPRMSSELETFLGKVEKDITEGKNFSGPFSSKKEVDGYFDSL